MGLFRPAWQSGEWKKKDKALQAVAKETNQATLATIAKTAPLEEVRDAAALMLTAPQYLSEAVKEYDNRMSETWEKIRLSLTKNSFEEARRARQIGIMQTLVHKISDQSLLGEIARKANNTEVVEAALTELTDIPTLLGVARTTYKAHDILKRLPRAVIDDIVLHDPSTRFRCQAIKDYVTDQALLKELALQDPDADVRAMAASKLTDQAVIETIIKSEQEKNVVLSALNGLNNQAMLEELALNSSDAKLRRAALYKITSINTLAEIIKKETDKDIHWDAVTRFADHKMLPDFAHKGKENQKLLLELRKQNRRDINDVLQAQITDPEIKGQLDALIEEENRQDAIMKQIMYDIDIRSGM